MSGIIVNRDGPILRIALNRPERRNAPSYPVIDELLDALVPIAEDETCRAIVFSGNGSGFCSGDDLHGMGQPASPRWKGRKARPAVLPQQMLIRTLRTIPKPVVVAIHGYALGMRLDMALACDIRSCTETAEIGDPRTERALYAATGITYQLPRVIGYGRAISMMFPAERLSGKEAERIGLVYKAVPDSKFEAFVEKIVQRLAAAATKSIAVIKEQIKAQMDMPYELAARHSVAVRGMYTLEDTEEGVQAFLQKRPPKFKGK